MAFKDVTGHGRQKGFLMSVLSGERMPHAFLFTGQEGIGKRTMALAFAKAVLCRDGSGCGECPACLKVAKGLHPDLRLVESDGTIGIDEVRGNKEKRMVGINQEVFERPFEASHRVILIDRAESMTREATNALLKTLEEPPPFNLFILVTSSEKDVLRTVRSRCSRVAFAPLPQADVYEYLVRCHSLTSEKADLLALVAMGSIASALFWMDEENFALRRRLAAAVVGDPGGHAGASMTAEMISRDDRVLMQYLFFLLSFFRDLYAVAHGSDGAVLVNHDLLDVMRQREIGKSWVIESIRIVQETIRNMRYNVNRWMAVENLLVRIMR